MKKKKERYTQGLALTGIAIFTLVYTFFYTSVYRTFQGPAGDYVQSTALAMTAVLAGMLIELGRFWGWVIEFRVDSDLLVIQGIPAAILCIIPGPVWLQLGGNVFPYIFFADPVVTGISGVWLGVVLFRGLFNNKKVREEEEDKNSRKDKRPYEI